MPRTYTRRPIEERFWEKVAKAGPDECWEWTAARAKVPGANHGRINAGGKGSSLVASRVSWELHNGPIPDGMAVCHRCDNPPCVNPAHLFLDTVLGNFNDMRAKGRNRAGSHNLRGSQLPIAKLTEEKVLQIRARRASGEQLRPLAESFGVSRSTIEKVCYREIWTHI